MKILRSRIHPPLSLTQIPDITTSTYISDTESSSFYYFRLATHASEEEDDEDQKKKKNLKVLPHFRQNAQIPSAVRCSEHWKSFHAA